MKKPPCSWIGRINTVKVATFPKQLTDSVQSMSIQTQFFTEIENKKIVLYGNTNNLG